MKIDNDTKEIFNSLMAILPYAIAGGVLKEMSKNVYIMKSDDVVAGSSLVLKIFYYAMYVLGTNSMILYCDPLFWEDLKLLVIKEVHCTDLKDMMKHLEFLKPKPKDKIELVECLV